MAARGIAKPLIFAVCLAPLAWLAWKGMSGGLGANPNETVNRFLGDWTLRFLLITLAVTPLRGLLGWKSVIRYRRMLGLFAFAYACLHLTSYVAADQFFDWPEIWADIVKRRYITVGMASFVLLVPLALTSTDKMARRLGGRRWKMLHRLVYAIALGGVLHFAMMVKADLREPLIYAAVLALLLGYRVVVALRIKRAAEPGRKSGIQAV